jgi:D-tyrosyl-tRNA(Tyr) deacylase|tara:strand:- start:924 stop:1370 length:447 start_codon:yes stop_codon:yes gene_type:complete
MIIVAQRCSKAQVLINNKTISQIDSGLMLLVGINKGDELLDADKAVDKIVNLRIFNDEKNKMNLSVLDTRGSIMVVSQFTLCGDIKKGRRPSFINAESPDKGLLIYEYMVNRLRDKGINTVTGEFGAMMDIELVNEGPVTFVIDSKEL